MDNKILSPGIIYLDLPRPPSERVAAFASIGVADVHEGMSTDGVLSPDIHAILPGAHIAGPALTVLCAAGDTLMMHRALALSQPGDVIVIVTDQPTLTAMWGNLVTTCAKARGVAGVIVDGPIRDVAAIHAMQFPVWARMVSPRTSTRKGPGCINIPVLCGGIVIHPGDLIVADDDGVVVVPADKIEATLTKAQARGQREANALPHLAKGITPFELWGMNQYQHEAGIPEVSGCCPDSSKPAGENHA
jgi:4-hydroxy-4-methyl-2-oxoglutarate aldolase